MRKDRNREEWKEKIRKDPTSTSGAYKALVRVQERHHSHVRNDRISGAQQKAAGQGRAGSWR
jgi:hypothetical protein